MNILYLSFIMSASAVTVAAAKSSSNLNKGKVTETAGTGAGGIGKLSTSNAAPATSVGVMSENGRSLHVLQVETLKSVVDVHFPSDGVVRVISPLSLLCPHAQWQ